MSRTAPIHHLTNVDLEHRTAICSVCGPAQIYVVKNRTHPHRKARVYCMTRVRESGQAQYHRLREQKRLQNPNWKPRHLLSKIDVQKMTAICSVCGPTDIRKRTVNQKGTFFICATKKREYTHEYRLSHYVPQPRKPRRSGHSLSEIDDENKTAVCQECGPVQIYVSQVQGKTIRRCSKASIKYVVQVQQKNKELINEYTIQHGCQRCGYNASPLVLELHRRNVEEKDDKIWRLVRFSRKRLLKELEKSEVFCVNCHRLVHDELGT